jgi:hypothetical protein
VRRPTIRSFRPSRLLWWWSASIWIFFSSSGNDDDEDDDDDVVANAFVSHRLQYPLEFFMTTMGTGRAEWMGRIRLFDIVSSYRSQQFRVIAPNRPGLLRSASKLLQIVPNLCDLLTKLLSYLHRFSCSESSL